MSHNSAMNGTGDYQWSEVDECPICHHKGWCQVSAGGELLQCMRTAEGAFKAGTDADGNPYHLHRLKDSLDFGRSPSTPKRQKPPNDNEPERTAAGTLDQVYRATLDRMALDSRHRDDLKRRGFDDDALEALGYRSLRSRDHRKHAEALAEQFGAGTLARVPGFYLDEHGAAMVGMNGLLIPVHDLQGRIIALKVRLDVPMKKGGKYAYLSSKKKGGPGPGSPVHVPSGILGPVPILRITEGELKADFATRRSDVPTISIAGVQKWRSGVEAAKSLGAKTIRVAFDADVISKKDVARPLVLFCKALATAGFNVEVERWPLVDGKGIDDVLANGKTPSVFEGRAAMDEVDQLAAAHGVDVDAPGQSLMDRVRQAVEESGPESIFEDKRLLEALARSNNTDLGAIKTYLRNKVSIRALDKALKEHAPKPEPGSFLPAFKPSYRVQDSCLVVEEMGQDGPVSTLLTNFAIFIVEEVVRDDGGGNQSVHFRLEGRLSTGEPLTTEVSASEFEAMGWIVAKLGSRAILTAGRGIREHARAAIQEYSAGATRTVVYTHTGWRRIGDRWFYLSGSGAIGAEGLDRSVKVDLDSCGLADYRLPAPPEKPEDIRRAVRASLDILRLHQPNRAHSRAVAAMTLSHPYRAAFGATRFGVQLLGATGAHKSCVAALSQQHFGSRMDYGHLPGAWSATAAAIQHMRHALKDALLVVDDLVPGGSPREREKTERQAEEVFRSQGNGAARRRAGTDGKVKEPMDPRGALLSTGEDRPGKASANLRTITAWFDREDSVKGITGTIDRDILSACQADASAGLYAQSLAAFVRWMAPRYEELQESHVDLVKETRALATRPGDHGRTPEIVAELVVGFDYFLRFAVEVDAVTQAAAEDIRADVWDGLLDAADGMREDHQAESDPAETFLRVVAASLTSGTSYIDDLDTDDVPDGQETRCGWHRELKWQGNDAGQVPMWIHGPNARKIGWINTKEDLVYLDPDAAYYAATQMLREQGETLPARATLQKLLHSARKLARTDSRNTGENRNRFTCRVMIRGRRLALLIIRASDLWGGSEEDSEATEAVGEAVA